MLKLGKEIDVLNGDISYQNKDVISKVFADNFRGKSLKVYGLDVPKVVQVLPTNLPEVEANELRLDNLFLLEDGTIAIIDYESEYKKKNRNKYINYIARVLKRYEKQNVIDIKLRMIVIYTADVQPKEVESLYDLGDMTLEVEDAFLSNIDSKEVRKRLSDKVKNGSTFTDEELMEFIILPLTYKDVDRKRYAIKDAFELAKEIQDESTMAFVLAGMLVFADKVIDKQTSDRMREWLSMTKVARLFEIEKEEALARQEAEFAKERAEYEKRNAMMDARIKELEEQLALAGIQQ